MTEVQPLPPSALEALRMYNAQEAPRTQADIEEEIRMKAALFSIPAELIQMPYVTLCSVWPEALVSQPFVHGGIARKFYYMEPGSPEKPSTLLLQNTFQGVTVNQGNGDPGQDAKPILAGQIAVDLISHWTGDHPGNRKGKKGIGVIQGRVEDGKIIPLPQEIAALEKTQREFLSFLVERADEYHDLGKREKITNEHRKALKMLGLDETQHPWYRAKRMQFNSCPACQKRIEQNVYKCAFCHTDLAEHFMMMDEVPSAELWPMVVKVIDRRTSKNRKEEQ